MADRYQLPTLKAGSEAWNAWREKKPGLPVNLSGAKLYQTSLSEAILHKRHSLTEKSGS